MSVLYLLVPLALLMSGGAVWLFWWATRRGQFDDLETPALRVLMEEEGPRAREGRAPGRSGGAG
jgi:cbb3-type cytochrome oxidase maturation protein